MPSLYNEYEMMNDEANQLCQELQFFISPLIARWIARGYPLREIESVIINDIHVTFCEELLQQSINYHRAKYTKK